jgi:hypothetical protein
MKLFLDDIRNPPHGWLVVRTPDQVIDELKYRNVSYLSLDHDLGFDALGNELCGYEVLCWIENAVAVDNFKPPVMSVHPANPVGRARMEAAIQNIWNIYNRNL